MTIPVPETGKQYWLGRKSLDTCPGNCGQPAGCSTPALPLVMRERKDRDELQENVFVCTGRMHSAEFGIFNAVAQSAVEMIEPDAGGWATWLLDTSSQFRMNVPPNEAATADEIAKLITMAGERNEEALQQIAYWNAGPPSYRWNQITVGAIDKRGIPGASASRILALVHAAIYDATVAAWDSKYTYNRPRPSTFDDALTTVIPNPVSPSYPSEYAVTAGAASAVLASLFPDDAEFFEVQAQAAVNSRLLAGVEYPSDVEAGLELGRQVAELAIAYGTADGSNAAWTGSVPTEPTGWRGENPIAPQSGSWQTWALSSPDQFLPAPPPAYDWRNWLPKWRSCAALNALLSAMPRRCIGSSALVRVSITSSGMTLLAA